MQTEQNTHEAKEPRAYGGNILILLIILFFVMGAMLTWILIER